MVVGVVVLMSLVAPAVSVAVVVEVWFEYPLPQFLELPANRRCEALTQARALRHRWSRQLFWNGPLWFPAETAIRRAAAIAEAALCASRHLSAYAEVLYFWQHVHADPHVPSNWPLPVAAPAA